MTEEAVPTKPEQSEADLARAADVEEYLRDVIDPELGINVVDLGLVYDIWIENNDEAQVNMTLTSPACPLTDVLEDQAQSAVVGNGAASKLTINWVWMPPWGPHMITEDGREQLRALGFSV
ncbi:metal-sulfur cluster assembly factor [Corynebacterium sp. 153RC1]|uniref:metal-sulfur cluster assembly factor n=1 Tax=Corynebacterium TaxID=1716 RepID=UPI00211CC623|nr:MULTISPECIES: metal-sulfur cluster assembly factor [unclassified Corynebacterium]MCQ9369741.1 metal-sulfur cluster assembly factor [Corynebacterium sp. 35RC1]MCQ9342835.1 metal-sulfur cluster assembly factor [Corynebacterium sp. 76QC2CO]MCQ9352400.1 metal-sulfur cluster assembly factor [Corynebacterium sp. 209RC1]MCQ9354428.1 metal-sulfur cluster assembly factor [Corynebacterium sp. 1222RC1]MCQ9356683.1 metal-sulfur cluster assembly factor [Corynebacterium sp. 122RC1]